MVGAFEAIDDVKMCGSGVDVGGDLRGPQCGAAGGAKVPCCHVAGF